MKATQVILAHTALAAPEPANWHSPAQSQRIPQAGGALGGASAHAVPKARSALEPGSGSNLHSADRDCEKCPSTHQDKEGTLLT